VALACGALVGSTVSVVASVRVYSACATTCMVAPRVRGATGAVGAAGAMGAVMRALRSGGARGHDGREEQEGGCDRCKAGAWEVEVMA
jgi:hypothetical protein